MYEPRGPMEPLVYFATWYATSYAILVAELRYHLLLIARVDLSNNNKQFTVT